MDTVYGRQSENRNSWLLKPCAAGSRPKAASRDEEPWTLDSPGGFDVLQFVVLRLERWTADIEPRTSNLEPLP
jgi:hypothetical protein